MEIYEEYDLGRLTTAEELAKGVIRGLIDHCGFTAGDADGLIADWGDSISIKASVSSNVAWSILNTMGVNTTCPLPSSASATSNFILTVVRGVSGTLAIRVREAKSSSASNPSLFMVDKDTVLFMGSNSLYGVISSDGKIISYSFTSSIPLYTSDGVVFFPLPKLFQNSFFGDLFFVCWCPSAVKSTLTGRNVIFTDNGKQFLSCYSGSSSQPQGALLRIS